jgi:hypothetical protein
MPRPVGADELPGGVGAGPAARLADAAARRLRGAGEHRPDHGGRRLPAAAVLCVAPLPGDLCDLPDAEMPPHARRDLRPQLDPDPRHGHCPVRLPRRLRHLGAPTTLPRPARQLPDPRILRAPPPRRTTCWWRRSSATTGGRAQPRRRHRPAARLRWRCRRLGRCTTTSPPTSASYSCGVPPCVARSARPRPAGDRLTPASRRLLVYPGRYAFGTFSYPLLVRWAPSPSSTNYTMCLWHARRAYLRGARARSLGPASCSSAPAAASSSLRPPPAVRHPALAPFAVSGRSRLRC